MHEGAAFLGYNWMIAELNTGVCRKKNHDYLRSSISIQSVASNSGGPAPSSSFSAPVAGVVATAG